MGLLYIHPMVPLRAFDIGRWAWVRRLGLPAHTENVRYIPCYCAHQCVGMAVQNNECLAECEKPVWPPEHRRWGFHVRFSYKGVTCGWDDDERWSVGTMTSFLGNQHNHDTSDLPSSLRPLRCYFISVDPLASLIKTPSSSGWLAR